MIGAAGTTDTLAVVYGPIVLAGLLGKQGINPGADIVVNERTIGGVLNAVTELHLAQTKLTIIGYDSGQKQIDAINSGLEFGAVQQNPIGIGAKCVVEAMLAIKGQTTFDKVVDTGFLWADKTTINNADVQAVLYK